MTNTDKRYTINVAINAEVRAALDAMAKAQAASGDKQRFAGDVVRDAIQEYLQKRGVNLAVKVDRGGYRPRKTAE